MGWMQDGAPACDRLAISLARIEIEGPNMMRPGTTSNITSTPAFINAGIESWPFFELHPLVGVD